MANCKNRKCGAILSGHYWGDGYCSYRCMHNTLPPEMDDDDAVHDPTDPTGHRVVCRTRGEMAAMIEAAAIHPKLPKIIYMRKRHKTYRDIGKECHIDEKTVRNILRKSARNLLRECGLPIK